MDGKTSQSRSDGYRYLDSSCPYLRWDAPERCAGCLERPPLLHRPARAARKGFDAMFILVALRLDFATLRALSRA